MALFLTILKIIGIVLLVILVVLLAALLLVLFCPVAYRVKGEKRERLLLHMRVSWLFPFLYGKLKYEEGLSCILYLAGIPVYDVFGRKGAKIEKQEKKRKKNKRRKKNQKKEYTKEEHATKKELSARSMEPDRPTAYVPDIPSCEEPRTTPEESDEPDRSKEQPQEETISFLGKLIKSIKEFFQKGKLFFQKVFEKVRNIKYTILNIKEKLEHIKETIYWYKEVLEREESRRAIAKGKQQILRFLKHIAPKKVSGNIVFGFGDPGTTGEVLGFISMFYPLFGNHITVIPDFEQTIFWGDFFIKGRIRVFNLLKIGWSVLFDKDIKKLYNILTGGKDHE